MSYSTCLTPSLVGEGTQVYIGQTHKTFKQRGDQCFYGRKDRQTNRGKSGKGDGPTDGQSS